MKEKELERLTNLKQIEKELHKKDLMLHLLLVLAEFLIL